MARFLYLDQEAADKAAMYTYAQIARLKQLDPELGRRLQQEYSAARATGDARIEMDAGLHVERVHSEHLRELVQLGLVES